MSIETMDHWDNNIRPFLQVSECHVRNATHQVHEAGYLICRLPERPSFTTNVEAELASLEKAAVTLLADIRTVRAAYSVKPMMNQLVAAE
jgi:hypothetical protein